MAHDFDDGEAVDGELLNINKAGEQLPQALMILKMENESIMAAARVSPRDSMVIVKQLTDLIEAYPSAAEEAVYSRPVGSTYEVTCSKCQLKYEEGWVSNDTVCPNCDSPAKRDNHKQRKVTKFAEGLSIRAAESIRSIYGYTRLSVTNEMQPDGSIKITGTIVDYAAGNMTSDERIVSPYYTAKGGVTKKHPADRFLNVLVKAEKSKLKRDIILDSVPNIVKAAFRDVCEKKMVALVSPELIQQKVLPAFAEYGITQEHLEKLIGRTLKMGWKEEDRLQLRKLLAALKNEETTARDLLASLEDDATGTPATDAKQAPPTTKPTTLNDVADAAAEKLAASGGEYSYESVMRDITAATTVKAVEKLQADYTGPDGGFSTRESDEILQACELKIVELKAPKSDKPATQKGLLDKGNQQPE